MIEAAEPTRAPELLRRPWVAALLVLAVYGVLALLNSTGGYLGTDTGAKVITLDQMAEDNTFSPAIGYWAEEWDPDGTYHPLLDTVQNEDGEWINVTTLPMLVVARPLYDVGGYRLALLWPMLGALLAAFACRDVARQLSDEQAGWTAFWLTALTGPLAIYALDLWEHSLGAGLMVGSFALLLRVVGGSTSWLSPLVAGLALGASASMRTESFVAAFVFVAATCLFVALRKSWLLAARTGALAVVGFALMWASNAWLEAELGGNSRAGRAAGVASGDWWSEISVRAKEAAITWFGLPGASYPGSVLLGALAIGSLLLAGRLLRRGDDRVGHVVLVVAGLCYLLGLSGGLAFVSGALVTAPVASLAVLLRRWDPVRGLVAAVAVATTVLIWLFQFTGGAGPQWGGRYILAPTLLLLSLGAVALREVPRAVATAAVGASLVVACLGFAWLWQRSHGVERFFDEVAERPEDVIISTNGFLVREAGPAYAERRYLSVGRSGDVAGALDVAADSGARTVGVLTDSATPPGVGGERRSTTELDLLGVPLFIHSFELAR